MPFDFNEYKALIQDIKDKVRIEQVIAKTQHLEGSGRYLRFAEDKSLVIDVEKQIYTQFGSGSEGRGRDVLHWLEHHEGMSQHDALSYLCKLANIPEPQWSKGNGRDPEKYKAMRRMGETLNIIVEWYRGMLWKSPEALEWCHKRAWTDETIQFMTRTEEGVRYGAGLGYTGTFADRDDLRKTLGMYEIELDCPVAVAVLGFKGNVAQWWDKWGAQCSAPEPETQWVPEGRIGGMPERMVVNPYY
jgi:hypothetical protein